MKSRFVFFPVAVAVWLLLSWPPDREHVLTGVAIALLVTLLAGDLFATRPHLFARPVRYAWFLGYLVIFGWEFFKATAAVTLRIMHPDLPLSPGIVRVRTTLKSDTGLTFLANSITLARGAMTVDVDRGNGYLYIHWLQVTTSDEEEATRRIVSRFEKVLARVFE
ncbi:MAG: Na+/H+ antiporter subunit E [Planctomycetota bacterium]